MNLFCFSSNYILECIIPNLSYLLGRNIEKLFIYREDYDNSFFSVVADFEILYVSSLEKALEESHMVVLFRDGHISNSFADNICSECTRMKKKYYDIDLLSISQPYVSCVSNYNLPKDKPVVLICYDSGPSKYEQMELALTKLFYESNIRIKQLFSEKTSKIINFLSTNDSIYKKSNNTINFDIVVLSISLEDLSSTSLDVYRDILSLKPDYTLFCVQNSFNQLKYIESLLKYKYNLILDAVVFSNYVKFKQNNYLINYVKTRIYKNNAFDGSIVNALIPYDNCAEYYIRDKIISKLVIPPDVKMII